MSIPELIDHGEAASAPVADNRRGDGNPAAQNGLQSRPQEVPPPPTDTLTRDLHVRPCDLWPAASWFTL